LSEKPNQCVTIVKERLKDSGVKNIKIIKHPGLGEVIAPHYELKVGKETIAFVYEPLACHSYNIIYIKKKFCKSSYNRYYVEFLFSIFVFRPCLL